MFEPGEFAKVVEHGSEVYGRIGKILAFDYGATTDWVTLDIDGEEYVFAASEVRPVSERRRNAKRRDLVL